MNDREIRNQIHHAMDTRLSGMTGNPYLARRILAGAKGGKKVKRKLSVGLVVALVLLCMSVTALAVGVLINEYYERVAQMDASGDMMRWELEDKINFIHVMRDFELTVDEEDYALMMDGTKTAEERENAADRMIDARYGALIREEVATWYQQPEDISDVAPNETIIFKERYMAEHPEGITTREDYIQFTDALGYYLRDVYYPAYEARAASLPQSTPVPEGTEAYAVQSLRSAMTELLSWDAKAAESLTPEVVWDEEYQIWIVSGEVSKASMEKAFEPVLDRPTIVETETGYRLTILVDTRGNASYFSLDKDAFRASCQDKITPVTNVTDDEAEALAKAAVMERYSLTEEEINLLFCEASYAGMDEDNALLTRCVFHTHYLYDREDMYGAVINRATGTVTEVYSYAELQDHPSDSDGMTSPQAEAAGMDDAAAIRLTWTAFCEAWQLDSGAMDEWNIIAQQVHDDYLGRGMVYYRVYITVPEGKTDSFYGRANFSYRVLMDGTLMDASMMPGWYSPAQDKALLDEQQLYDHELYRQFDQYAQKKGLLMDCEDFFHWPLEHQKAFADEMRTMIADRRQADPTFSDPRLLAFANHVYGVPQDGMLTREEAVTVAGKALQNAFGLTNAERAYLKPEIVLLDVTDDANPFYQISYSSEKEWTSSTREGLQPSLYYAVEVNAETGEVRSTYTYGREDGQTGIAAWERWY